LTMRAKLRIARHFFHALYQWLGDCPADRISFSVDFMPAKAHRIDQKRLDNSVFAKLLERLKSPFRREADSLIWLVLEQAHLPQACHHAVDGGRTHIQQVSQR